MTLSRFEALGLLPDDYVRCNKYNKGEWDFFGLKPEEAVPLFEHASYFIHRGQI